MVTWTWFLSFVLFEMDQTNIERRMSSDKIPFKQKLKSRNISFEFKRAPKPFVVKVVLSSKSRKKIIESVSRPEERVTTDASFDHTRKSRATCTKWGLRPV